MKDRTRRRTRRHFLADMGASAIALSAASALNSLAAASPNDARARANPVRIGVVGGGFGSEFQWHLHPHAKVAAVCDLREDRIERLKTTYRSSNGYKDYAQFLMHPSLDAVAVFTPAPNHVDMAVEALRHGKHVISAVPAGLSQEELERLRDTVVETGLKYMMAETSRYHADTLTCIDWARQGKFGTIFYSEAEYHHTGLAPFAYGTSFDCQSCVRFEDIQPERQAEVLSRLVPTWSYGYPPMLYPTHSTGPIVSVTGERLVEVVAHGWGDDHEMLKENYYDNNPFFNTVALFKTSQGHSSRISIAWHIAAPGTERAAFYGDRHSYIMARPEGSPATLVTQLADPPNSPYGTYAGQVEAEEFQNPTYHDRLPEPLRVSTNHGGSHTFITHEFISSIVDDRLPEVNVWEAIAYTLPGIIAHKSALDGGKSLKIPDLGSAPG